MAQKISSPVCARDPALEPRVGDTWILEGTAVMVLAEPWEGAWGGQVRFRTRSGLVKGMWEDVLSLDLWKKFVENWRGAGALFVPAESPEQIFPRLKGEQLVRDEKRRLARLAYEALRNAPEVTFGMGGRP